MPTFRTDQVLWYNNGVWGQLGYAVPNYGNDPTTVNFGIAYLVGVIGRNLAAIMHHPDVDSRTPPTINTLARLHKLITRARTIMAGRDLTPGEFEMEAIHATPAQQDFLIYPVPYFKVRNGWLKEYAGLVLCAISEACQHGENRKPYEFTTAFSGVVGQYLARVYRLMATELFGVAVEEAKKPDFTLTDAILASYDPGKWFTQTELIDTVAPLNLIPTEDDKRILTDGIPASLLVNLQTYPTGGSPDPDGTAAAGIDAATGTTVAAVSTPSFRPAPTV